MELFFKMQFVKNVLVCVFGVFTFSVFCYCFYEGFIPKIILVSWFYFLFVSVICSKSLDLTLESSATECNFWCLILFHTSACNIFLFAHLWQWFSERQQKCCWILLLAWIQLYFLLTLSKLVLFEFPILIPLVFYLIQSVSAEETLNCISRIRFRRTFIWPWVNQYMVYGFDSSSIGHFPAMVCSISAEGSLNLVAH